MSSQTHSFSNSTTFSDNMDEGKLNDNSNGTKYDSYPGRKSNLARLHVESQNEGVVSALETLQSKLRRLQQEKDAAQKAGNRLSVQPSSKLSGPESSWSRELTDVESTCHSLQNNLLNMLKIIHFEEESDLVATTEPRAITRLKSGWIMPQPPSTDPKVNDENKPIENAAKSCQTAVGDNSKLTTGRLLKYPHPRLTTKQLPFILSGITGKSFSLPVNIQLLVASLKTHNPWMCSLASDCAAMRELILKVEHDLKDSITALRDSIGYLTLESCSIRKQIILPQDIQDQRIQQITNHRNALIAHMHKMDTLAKQLRNFKKHLNSSNGIPSATGHTAERQTTKVNTHTVKHKKLSVDTAKYHAGKIKASKRQKIRCNDRPPWNDRITPDAMPPRRLSVGSIKYRELLQMALKRNGFKLKERES